MTSSSTPKKPLRLLPLIFLAIVLLWLGFRLIFPNIPSIFAGNPPDNLGVLSGKLNPCPNTPNCVSSQSSDLVHAIAPISYSGSPQEAIEKIAKIIANQPRTAIITQESNYLYAQFASQWMGFVDDLELYADPDHPAIEVRSASRLGESDLGVNRQRVETLRTLFNS
jgi:uncharacterized protein (DUF1499 family)